MAFDLSGQRVGIGQIVPAAASDLDALPRMGVLSATPSGRVLLFADVEPVVVSQVMYADTVAGQGRVFAYGVNGTQAQQQVRIVARSATGAIVRVTRVGHGRPTTAGNAFATGASALANWLASQGGGTYYVPADGQVVLAAGPWAGVGQVWETILDFDATAQVQVVIAAAGPGESLPQQYQTMPTPIRRGTFAGADVHLAVQSNGTGDLLTFPPPPYPPAVQGYSALDPGIAPDNSGNWGIYYIIDFEVSPPQEEWVTWLLAPFSGPNHGANGAVLVQNATVLVARSGSDLHYGTAEAFAGRNFGGGGGDSIQIATMASGGSYYPVAIVAAPSQPPAPVGGKIALVLGGLGVAAGTTLALLPPPPHY